MWDRVHRFGIDLGSIWDRFAIDLGLKLKNHHFQKKLDSHASLYELDRLGIFRRLKIKRNSLSYRFENICTVLNYCVSHSKLHVTGRSDTGPVWGRNQRRRSTRGLMCNISSVLIPFQHGLRIRVDFIRIRINLRETTGIRSSRNNPDNPDSDVG